jgi:UDP-N-acetylmuramate dehydrogenase
VNPTALKNHGIAVREHAPLGEFVTFRIGGPCPLLIACETPSQLTVAAHELTAGGTPFVLIGGGSNLLVSDDGVEAVVLRYCSDRRQIRREGSVIEAAASMPLDDLALYTVEEGLDGLVCCSGIPGTVGGAVAGNAGAFGKQIGDRVESGLLMDRRGATRWDVADRLGFAYRSSRLQGSGDIAVTVRLRLEPGDAARLRREREDILSLRREKHPDWRTTPTAGSFFRNIEPTSAAERRQAAGWFLEQAGAKELKVGGARVFEKHANIIVADPGCRARDVLELSRRMAAAVKAKFGFDLVPEVRLLGTFE